jgi:hypothetical protein
VASALRDHGYEVFSFLFLPQLDLFRILVLNWIGQVDVGRYKKDTWTGWHAKWHRFGFGLFWDVDYFLQITYAIGLFLNTTQCTY